MQTLKKTVKVLVITVLVTVLSNFVAMPVQAQLVYQDVQPDGSFCAYHYDNFTGVHDYDVCWTKSTNGYAFIDVT